MINKINRIKGLGVFNDFKWGISVENFSTVNIIYGANGSGKTTLTNLFRVFSNDLDAEDKEKMIKKIKNNENFEIEIIWDGKKLKSYSDSKLILVFNSSFVADHVFEGYQVKLKEFKSGVVTEEQLKNPKIKKIDEKTQKLNAEKQKLEKALNDLENLATQKRKELSKRWNKNIKGSRLPTNLDLKREDKIPKKSPHKKLDELYEELEEHFRKFRLSQNQDEIQQDILGLLSIQLNEMNNGINIKEILSKEISQNVLNKVAKKIEDLKKIHLKHSSTQDWFEDGVILLKGIKEKNVCPLCDSEINAKKIIESYNAFFSNEFEKLQDSLKNIKTEINLNLENLKQFNLLRNLLNQIINKYQLYFEDNKIEIIRKSTYEETIFTKLEKIIEIKKDNINYLPTNSDLQLIKAYTNTIRSFNEKLYQIQELRQSTIEELRKITFDDQAARVTAKELFWKSFDEEGFNYAKKFFKDKKEKNNYGGIEFFWWLIRKRKDLGKEFRRLDSERKILLAELKNEAKYVNKFLKKLSITNFQIKIDTEKEEKDIEIIYKSGTHKKGIRLSLSEGEKTALAFAYFLSKIQYEICDNKEDDLANYVIVIDDPVSSLDENRLFSTALLIKNQFVLKSKQLFLLSHNLVFLKFFSNILSRDANSSRVDYYLENGKILMLPPSLRNYQTSYFYKIRKLQDFLSRKIDYETAKDFLPNHIRIILEVFLSFKLCRLKQGSGVQDKYKTPGLDKLISSLKGVSLRNFESFEEINSDNVIDILWNIKNKVDSESHGSIQDLTNFEFISESELRQIAKQTLDIIAFLDQIHYKKIQDIN